MVMKLYGFNVTPNVVRAVLPLFLAEVDIEKEVEFVHVNYTNHQAKSPAYKSKQIFGLVPLLEDGDVTVFESRAIAKYIAEKYVEKCPILLGQTLKERAVINTWMESEAHNVYPVAAPVIRELYLSRAHKRPVNEEILGPALANLNTAMDAYEAHLSKTKNRYLAGENYTLADAFHTPAMQWVITEAAFKEVLDNHPHVAAWIADITSLPAFQKCLQVDWDKATPFQE